MNRQLARLVGEVLHQNIERFDIGAVIGQGRSYPPYPARNWSQSGIGQSYIGLPIGSRHGYFHLIASVALEHKRPVLGRTRVHCRLAGLAVIEGSQNLYVIRRV